MTTPRRSTVFLMLAMAVGIHVGFAHSVVVRAQSFGATVPINLLSTSQWTDSIGEVHAIGEVQNVGSQNAAFVQLSINEYNASNGLVGTDTVFTEVSVLAPGDRSAFDDLFTPPAGYASFTVAAISDDVGGPPNHLFTTTITNDTVDNIGERHIVGTVKNDNTTTSSFVSVNFTFYSGATAVDADFTYVNTGSNASVAPGDTAAFEEVLQSDSPGISAPFRFLTQSSSAPSPPPPPPPPPAPPYLAGVEGSDGQLWVTVGGGRGFTPLGGQLLGAPAITWVANPRGGGSYLYIVTGTDHQLWARTDQAGWQPLSKASIYCLDNPAAVVTGAAGAQTLTVACQGSDLQLYVTSTAVTSGAVPSVGGFRGLGGVLSAGPGVVLLGGAVTFFVTGTDGHIYSRTYTTGFGQYPWFCKGHPAVGAGGGRAWFGCHGTDDQLWYASNPGSGWTGATPAGGVLLDGIGVAPIGHGATFFAEGTDQAVYELSVTSSTPAGGWQRDGGAANGGAGAA